MADTIDEAVEGYIMRGHSLPRVGSDNFEDLHKAYMRFGCGISEKTNGRGFRMFPINEVDRNQVIRRYYHLGRMIGRFYSEDDISDDVKEIFNEAQHLTAKTDPSANTFQNYDNFYLD
jgi:hypothetical protein